MNSIRLVLLIFYACIQSLFCHSQETEKSFYVSSSLLTPTASQVPRWSFGAIYELNKKWLIGVDFEYGNYSLLFPGQKESTYIDLGYQSWLIQPQVYRVIKQSNSVTKYLSVDVFFTGHRDEFYDADKKENRYYLERGERIIYDEAKYHRTKVGLNLNYGVFMNISKRIGLDMSTGIGVRSLKVTYSDVINSESIGSGGDAGIRLGTNYYMQLRGKHTSVNFNADLKAYYRLGRN